jgi:hypothetical protein
MTFQNVSPDILRSLGQRLEQLAKSNVVAGYNGLAAAGRTGTGALVKENLDPIIQSITLQQSMFMLTKNIPQVKVNQTVYTYVVNTSVGTEVDLAGYEAFVPQEDQSQYVRVAEVIKTYGIKKSITQLAQFQNEANGYMLDVDKRLDEEAALAMANQLERDLYTGGDYFLDAAGAINPYVANNPNPGPVPVRGLRGIQSNIREGNIALRGIPGDFVAYGNDNSTVFDRKGGVIERGFIDAVVTAIRNSMGTIGEAHCTNSQLAEFRATFFPIERADINAVYNINGPDISNDEGAVVRLNTCGGILEFRPTIFKQLRIRPVATQGSAGSAPVTPAVALAAGGSATGSGFAPGQVWSYRVAAESVLGRSQASTPATVTTTTQDAANTVTITNVASAELYSVYRSPVETSGRAGTELFIGKIVPSAGASTVFTDNAALVPGLSSVLLLPKDKERAKLLTIGNMLNKTELGIQGTASERIYTSYVGCMVTKPRTFAVIDSVYERRQGI